MLYGLNFTMKTLVERLREIVIKDVAVREAMLKVDRADFCPVDPYFDSPGDIGYGATISAPHMHAYALQNAYSRVLEAKPDGRILDVGSGSGYLTACFAYLTKGLVVGVEHVPELVADSITNIRKHHQDLLDQGRVKIVVGDGRKGCPLDALFAVIHVGAASPEIPQTLVEQLDVGGLMIIPVGTWDQKILLITKNEDKSLDIEESWPVRYVPLTDINLRQ